MAVQARARGLLARRARAREAAAALSVQAATRGMLARGFRRSRQESTAAALMVQKYQRGRASRRRTRARAACGSAEEGGVRAAPSLGSAKAAGAWRRSGRQVMLSNAVQRALESAAAERALTVKAYASYESWLEFRQQAPAAALKPSRRFSTGSLPPSPGAAAPPASCVQVGGSAGALLKSLERSRDRATKASQGDDDAAMLV